jgi:SAM-dependent methyltransferase
MTRDAATGHPAWVAYEPALVPSLEQMRTEGIEVLEEWFRWAEEWSMLLRVYGGITRTSAVLEIGCGQGRIAFPLRYLLSAEGSYDGFDIDRKKIAFLQETFQRAHSNFRFQHVDVHNSFYNPSGLLRGDAFRFPYADGAFDLVFAASVFTHMAPEVAANYLREAARVLTPGGRVVLSVFLLDYYRPGAERPAGFSHPRFNFDHPYGAFDQCEFAIANPENPEEMTAYSRRLLERLVADAGLAFQQPIVPGEWSASTRTWAGAQDLVVLRRAGGTP